MSTRQNIQVTLNPNPPKQLPHTQSKTGDIDINLQAADGWTVIGKYRGNILQTITLHKQSIKEFRK
jgi:hypothetical protein